jgi:hypothetical protein
MKARNLLFASLAALGVVAPATSAHALLVKVSVNFGPTVTGPDNGTLIVTANPGDLLIITWALGTDTDISRYSGIVSAVDGTEITRDVGSALELTGQGFDPGGNPNFPIPADLLYFVASDGAPTGFASNEGALWRIEYSVMGAVTDASADMTYSIGPGGCFTDTSGVCPGTSATDAVTASLRIDAVPEPATLPLLVSGLAGVAMLGRKARA